MAPESSTKVLRLIYDYMTGCCVYAAAKLNIPELLYEGPKTFTELAITTGTNPAALYRILRVLAGEGFIRETDDGIFTFAPEATALLGEREGSLKYYLQAIFSEHYQAYGQLLHSVRTGEAAFDHFHKADVWEYYGHHPEEALNFNKAMAGLTQYLAGSILRAYDFSPYHTIIDIGGGNGALLFSILQYTPEVKGVIFDAPIVIPQTEELIREHHLQERCSTFSGNFFEAIPEGGDAYLLKYILHDWTDTDAIRILQNCSRIMQAGSKVLVFESVMPPGNEWHSAKQMDVTMLVCTKGRERTEEEFRFLFKEAGLQFNRTVDIGLPEVSILEAEKP